MNENGNAIAAKPQHVNRVKALAPKVRDARPVAVNIKPPNFQVAEFKIRGTAPLVTSKFSDEAKRMMIQKYEEGSTGRSKRKVHEAKPTADLWKQAGHRFPNGEFGIPANAFRGALITACGVVDFKMTLAKQCLFIEADGYEKDEGWPLIKVLKGKPHGSSAPGRNADGSVQIRFRPMWDAGWETKLRVKFDADMFKLEDVSALLMRAGIGVGIGCGRPKSTDSNGCGWGTFEVLG